MSTENATKPKFDIHLSTEGILAELHFNEPKQVMNEKLLKKEISKEMKKRIENLYSLFKKYKVDVLELGEYIRSIIIKSGRKLVRIGIEARIILVMLKLMFTLIQQLNIQVQHYQRK